MNLPNKLTILRVIMIPFFVFFLLSGVGGSASKWIALVIFAIWRPNLSVLASFLFGGLYILYLYIPTGMDHMEYQELYKMIPYVVTLVVLVVTSIRSKRESQPPASLGLAYFREER